jgi:hypothetical protein
LPAPSWSEGWCRLLLRKLPQAIFANSYDSSLSVSKRQFEDPGLQANVLVDLYQLRLLKIWFLSRLTKVSCHCNPFTPDITEARKGSWDPEMSISGSYSLSWKIVVHHSPKLLAHVPLHSPTSKFHLIRKSW